MDRLKFRVWNIIDGKFDYLSKETIEILAKKERSKLLKEYNIDLGIDYNYYKFSDISLNSNGFLVANLYDEEMHETINLDNRFIAEMCTGLKDKNGNLIYDGDIVKDNQKDYCQCVKYSLYNGFILDIDDNSLAVRCVSVEVIGNIHENPELLEV